MSENLSTQLYGLILNGEQALINQMQKPAIYFLLDN